MIPTTQAMAKETPTEPLAVLSSPLLFVAGLENPLPAPSGPVQIIGVGMFLTRLLLKLLPVLEREEKRRLELGFEIFTVVQGTQSGRLDKQLQCGRQNEESMEVFVL